MRFPLNELGKSDRTEPKYKTYPLQADRHDPYREYRLLRLLLGGVDTNSTQRGLALGRTLSIDPCIKIKRLTKTSHQDENISPFPMQQKSNHKEHPFRKDSYLKGSLRRLIVFQALQLGLRL